MSKWTHLVLLGVLALAVPVARAGTLLTSTVGYSGPAFDLSAFANGMYNFGAGSNGAIALPNGISYTCGGGGCVAGQGSYGLASNGSLGSPATYAGLDSGEGFLQLAFSSPLSQFGLYLNYAPETGTPFIATFDSNGQLLSEFDLSASAPISTPGGFNSFVFRGIREDAPAIASFRVSNAYIVAAGTPDGSVPVAPVPEPGTFVLLGAGLVSVVAFRRRQARS